MARPTLAFLILAPLLAAQQPPRDKSFQQAGVCARCHVVQVLEWSASKHTAASTTCQSCHGSSEAHVANERNQVKPDRLPRDPAAFASLCASCHTQGCPKTRKSSDCQTCHHAHALANPDDRQLRQLSAPPLDPSLAAARARLAEAERLVALRNWSAARDAFADAARLQPADRRIAARLRMAERRLNPAIPGFEILGDAFDPDSGLPLHVRIPDLALDMRLVPAGETDIGADQWPHTRPVHSVETGPFYLAVHELTQQQWNRLNPANPSPHKGPDLPVHGISWLDAQDWIARLNARVPGGRFRLPTEAEWERAARPATAPRSPALPDIALPDIAWFRDNAATLQPAAGQFLESAAYAPRPVGRKQPNSLGFFDLQGNVAEWCSSLLQPYPYLHDSRESTAPSQELRVIRGGAYTDSAEFLHPAFRHSDRPSRPNPWTGLRLARSPF